MIGALQALALGALVGAVFALFRMPVPAPDNVAGVAGVVGLFLGWIVIASAFPRSHP